MLMFNDMGAVGVSEKITDFVGNKRGLQNVDVSSKNVLYHQFL